MKLEIYIEDGKPLLVFPEVITRSKTIQSYRIRDGRILLSRAYLRSLETPQSAEEIKSAWAMLAHYATLPT